MKTFTNWTDANRFAVSMTLRGLYCTTPLLIDGVWTVRHV